MNYESLFNELMMEFEDCGVVQHMQMSGNVRFGYSIESIAVLYPNHNSAQFIRFTDGIFEVTEDRNVNSVEPKTFSRFSHELATLSDLANYIHETIHTFADDMDEDEDEDEDEMNAYEDEFIQWNTELQVSANMDIPVKQETVTTIKIGEIKDNHQLVIKKTVVYIESEEQIQKSNVYLSLSQEEARKVLGELVKYTAS